MTNRSAPDATIVPILVYEDVAKASEWLCRVIDFTKRLRAARGGVKPRGADCGQHLTNRRSQPLAALKIRNVKLEGRK